MTFPCCGLTLLFSLIAAAANGADEDSGPVKTLGFTHASLAAYPNAVISLRDADQGTTFYVESDGRRLVAISRDGKPAWGVDVLNEVRVAPILGEPVIRHLNLVNGTLWATIGRSDSVRIDPKTGATEYAGRDAAPGDSENAQPQKKHPGHKMAVSFTPTKQQFKQGEPVEVTLKIQNVGDSTFAFMRGGRQRGVRDNQFGFTAQLGEKVVPDVGNADHHGGLAGRVVLNPGEQLEIPVDLKKWFAFDKEGAYMIRGSYYMGFTDPTGNAFPSIWEDFACAEFIVSIAK
jgi:hypothetical protein